MSSYKEFLCEYQHDGSTWCVTIHAKDRDDARQKLRAVSYGEVLGESMGSVPAVPGAGLWVRFVCWWKNRGRVNGGEG